LLLYCGLRLRVSGIIQHQHLKQLLLGFINRGDLAHWQPAEAAYAVSTVPVEDPYREAAIVKEGYKLIYTRKPSSQNLYRLPDEEHPITSALAEEMAQELFREVPALRKADSFVREIGARLSDEELAQARQRLSDLGYLE
jgi:hypothetical protein